MPFVFDVLVRRLDRLRYPWKFASIGVVILLGYAILFHQVHSTISREVAATEQQIVGLELLDRLFAILVISQQHRGLSFATLVSDTGMGAQLAERAAALKTHITSFDAEFGRNPEWQKLAPTWTEVRAELTGLLGAGQSMPAQANFDAHTASIERLLAQMAEVGERSGLAGDGDPQLSGVVSALLRKLPMLTEGLGRLRGYATGNLARASVGLEDEFVLGSHLALVASVEVALRDRLDRAAGGNAALAVPLQRAAVDIEQTIETLRQVVRTQVLGRAFAISPTELFDTGTVAIDTVLGHYRTTLRPAAHTLLSERIVTLRQNLDTNLLVIAAMTLVTAYLFGGIYFSIQRSVRELAQGAQQFANGNLSARIELSAHDELRQVADRFNAMAKGIADLLGSQLRSNRRLDELLRNNPSVIFALTPDTLQCNFLSPNACALLGKTGCAPDSSPGWWLESMHADDRERALNATTQWSLDGHPGILQHTYRLHRDDGPPLWVEAQLSALRDDEGRTIELVGSYTDISERRGAQTRLEFAASVFSHAREGITITDAKGNILNVNEAFTRITGYTREEVLGLNPRILQSGRQDAAFYVAMWTDVRAKGFWEGEIWNRRKSGEVYPEILTISAVLRDDGETSHYVAVFTDVSRQKELEQQLKQIAHFDALTGLPNRVLLADRLTQAIIHSRRTGRQVALLYIDLDGFKAVNDVHGHAAGDRLLVTLAERMRECLRAGDTIARLGGDEFVAVLTDLGHQAATSALIERLLAALGQPVQIDGLVLNVSGSIGVTYFPQREPVGADQLLRQADQAMYQAKLTGRNRAHVFDVEQSKSLRERSELVQRMREGLDKHQFVLHYQPKVNMRSGKVVGVEALIRWQHPEHGVLAPAAFLPAIAHHRIEVDLGAWVIDTALTQIETWRDAGLDLPVSVNIAGHHMQQPDFVDQLELLLGKHPRVPADFLELEVLESTALDDIAHVSKVIRACKAIGVGVALDDFGTGYSSLTYLKRLPAGVLKIDRCFVSDMLHDPDDLAILEGVLGLARAFQRTAIAEGVETVAHGKMLLQLGCELAQGYGIARPMAADDLTLWVASWRPKAVWSNTGRVPASQRAALYAAVEHRAWVAAVEQCVAEPGESPPVPLPHTARLEAWLRSLALQGSPPSPLAAVGTLQIAAHALGSELMALHESARADEAQRRLPELRALSDRLLGALEELVDTLAA